MSNFETILITKPSLDEKSSKLIIKNLEKNLKENSGKIIASEIWGLRDLAYSIKNNKKGFYHFLQINLESNKIEKIKNSLNLEENVIRYLIMKVSKHEKLPTIMMVKRENNEK